MIILNDTTFIIPLRIDSIERLENVVLLEQFINSCFDTKVIFLEADKEKNGFTDTLFSKRTNYIFIEDNDPIFHRTKYINLLSQKVTTEYIAVWDSDVMVHPHQIALVASRLRENTHDFAFPYDGNFLDTGVSHRIEFLRSRNLDYLLANTTTMSLPYTNTACGGGFVARLSDYIQCGGENENFYGWGQEDGERVKRWQIFGKRIIRVKGPMFHLYHPGGQIARTFPMNTEKNRLPSSIASVP